MPVINNPTWHHWPVLAHSLAHGEQRYGQFVLVRVDPVASVAIFDDAEASRSATLLPRDQWFLGIVVTNAGNHVRNAKDVPLLNLVIYLVGVGPDEPVSVAIPISPAAQLTDDHPPIQLDAELPWPDLYAHSLCALAAVITRIHEGPDYFPVCLTEEQLDAFSTVTIMDQYYRYDALRDEIEQSALARRATSVPTISVSGSRSAPSHSDCVAESESLGPGSESDDFMDCEEAQAITQIYDSRTVLAEMWLGPSAACPGQPAPLSAYDTLLSSLKKIANEWYDRKIGEAKARRSQMIADWNQRVREVAVVTVEGPAADAGQPPHCDAGVAAGLDAVEPPVAHGAFPLTPVDCYETPRAVDVALSPSFSGEARPQSESVSANLQAGSDATRTGVDGAPSPLPQHAQESPTASDNARALNEKGSSQDLETQVKVGKESSKMGSPESGLPATIANSTASAKSPTRNGRASMNRAAVKWFRSVVARTKARLGAVRGA